MFLFSRPRQRRSDLTASAACFLGALRACRAHWALALQLHLEALDLGLELKEDAMAPVLAEMAKGTSAQGLEWMETMRRWSLRLDVSQAMGSTIAASQSWEEAPK